MYFTLKHLMLLVSVIVLVVVVGVTLQERIVSPKHSMVFYMGVTTVAVNVYFFMVIAW